MTAPDTGKVYENHHTRTERVYFEHTDFSGVVYHGRYLDFLEHGRSDYVRMLGVHHSEMDAGRFGEPLAFAVHRMEIDYKGAARIDDVLTVTTHRGVLKGLRLTFKQSITCKDDVLIAAVVTVVLINREGKPRRYPAELQELLGIQSS
ncbi:YbgC/FadM family acyl-CoA thioesterase [Ahrensia sp. R2A130]|uniref:YbgC/FadM family acyl-CoA thioesterase n=1 Tax=Ahrensia sp. R2A130 TaxID=744979 RepID=UPI0001E0B4C9|nr:YbgC/FadM family acyl-CoA thioesterase [Ahrensia sp. R2A130]EFL88707.1 acyl-CoA thioester hydrolase YbgC [Ahrensia sp. R2A130]